MKAHLGALALGMLLARSASAQEATPTVPRVEVFGGFSYLRFPISQGINFVGWQASPDINFHKNIALALDFGGQYKSEFGVTLHQYEYATGPRFKYRMDRVTLFAHGLVGGAASHVSGFTQGEFLVGGGGGMDVNVNDRIAIRTFQLDSLHAHTRGAWGHALRLGVGVVFKFGGI